MDKKKVILTSLASVAVLGASVLVSQPLVVKADEGKAEEQLLLHNYKLEQKGRVVLKLKRYQKTLVQLILIRQIQLR